uniref:Uncharacterized protein n=1 Tax=Arundo donax TaxID=35708 RepID=A0A0A9CB67_ARUDO
MHFHPKSNVGRPITPAIISGTYYLASLHHCYFE